MIRVPAPVYHVALEIAAVFAVWSGLDEHGVWRDVALAAGVVLGVGALSPIIKWTWGSDAWRLCGGRVFRSAPRRVNHRKARQPTTERSRR